MILVELFQLAVFFFKLHPTVKGAEKYNPHLCHAALLYKAHICADPVIKVSAFSFSRGLAKIMSLTDFSDLGDILRG